MILTGQLPWKSLGHCIPVGPRVLIRNLPGIVTGLGRLGFDSTHGRRDLGKESRPRPLERLEHKSKRLRIRKRTGPAAQRALTVGWKIGMLVRFGQQILPGQKEIAND